jgi:uncharacterized protein (DUF1015 family)
MKLNINQDLLDKVALQVPQILLPDKTVDLKKWAVVACDQFTSEPEYWSEVDSFTKNSASTFHIIFPEVYLEEDGKEDRIKAINKTMKAYLDQKVLRDPMEGFVLVRRTMKNESIRTGLMVALDLEKYDFHAGSSAMIRATEKTVMDRIPPRVQIRKDAPIELPHVLVLIDDPTFSVIEPLLSIYEKPACQLYDTELMMDGGHLSAYQISETDTIHQIAEALSHLIKEDGYLYAVGDGNHSLATAKQCWDNLKNSLSSAELNSHPARYALVELNNIHDQGLVFEPIHRVMFDVNVADLKHYLSGNGKEVQLVQGSKTEKLRLKEYPSHLCVGVLQVLLDEYLQLHPEVKIDYIHGEKSLRKISDAADRLGFFLPSMDKADLFKTVSIDGALPRKTFSMGEAEEKRYYFECRKIR